MYKIYQIKTGDTLESVSNKFSVEKQTLQKINGFLMEQLIPGQYIIVPEAKQENSLFNTYVVKQGDSIFSLAKMFSINPSDLLKINGLEENDYIYPNQNLLVPIEGNGYYITKKNQTLDDLSNVINIPVENILNDNEKIYLLPEQLITYKKD